MDATTPSIEAAVERIRTEGLAVIPSGCSWLRQVDGHYCGLPEADVDRLPSTLKALL